MRKNPTPQQIAYYSSLRISGISFICFAGVLFLAGFRGDYWKLAIYAAFGSVGVFFAAYAIAMHFLKKYILRKIKVIYKTIHHRKLKPEEKEHYGNIDMQANIIEEVEKEVEEWAQDHQKQLTQYKSWAEYRRKYIGDISHELKTPIFNVQGYLHTLLDGALEDENVNRNYLEKACTNIDRLQTVVEDLESISRLESGRLILEMQDFDLKKLVAEVFEELQIKASGKNIDLIFKDGAATSYKVRADRDYIRQVLVNLLDNSIKYGNPGGRTKVGFYDMDRNILIEVADNGIGISKKHLNHVFDRFYRVDKSRSRAQGGSGLGLAIVKHIVEAHQQTINVRSTLNLGSTFGFTLEKA